MGKVVKLAIFACTKMKGTLLSYHLLVLFIGGVVMLSLSKINKHNFYHHYFRVIQEVEMRNSHFLLKVVTITSRYLASSIQQFLIATGLMQPVRCALQEKGVDYLQFTIPLNQKAIRFNKGLSPRAP